MKTNELIKEIRKNGDLDINFIRYTYRSERARKSFRNYLKNYIKHSQQVSDYIAYKVCDYYGIR